MARIIFGLKRVIRNYVQSTLKRGLYESVSTSGSGYPRTVRYFHLRDIIHNSLILPNIFIILWFILLYWGEVWVFQSCINRCNWSNWENWPKDASPHHLIFLADPQIIDPHSYPSRPWPLDRLTTIHTDKYLKRSYISLQKTLHPDTLFFLGDLFDGGREWSTFRTNVEDAQWGESERPTTEQPFVKLWAKKYGDNYWLQEYDRFGEIFYKFWNAGGLNPEPGQRGRKIISSLPGNHDLGFGDKIKISVRNRFQAYFGDVNRVDVIGNHTFVSIDSVSLSASGSDHQVTAITSPVENFLAKVQALKRRSVMRELGYMAGKDSLIQYAHKIEDLATTNYTTLSSIDPGLGSAEFPTILLTHVPLYREPGTPCGPKREHWPPTPPPKGQHSPVNPDERNAISISRGYQYQNVLSPNDSIRLLSSVGNVVSVFSGDDHDYCEIEHSADKNNVKEITIKSISWAMGIRHPGFLLLSMWNPVDESGRPLHSSQTASYVSASQASLTTQSHLCLLPDQIGILISYFCFFIVTLLILSLRSILIPILRVQPFSSQMERDSLPITEKSTNYRRINDLFRSSFSFASPSRAVKLSSRNYQCKTQINDRIEYGISSDYQMRDHTSIVEPTHNNGNFFYTRADDNNIELSNEYGAYYKQKRSCFRGLYLGQKGISSKDPSEIGSLKEVLSSIWRVAWVVTLIYLCFFFLH
ncbi:putative cell division control protein [Erysiphe necator]|uniref:Putative cell division control protein n=1 Tax=Uncinula necator TaxID=52586 RepID=A0A0B1P3A3_UNCNE|nr:putative cell division control protein [Erysiphe necator]